MVVKGRLSELCVEGKKGEVVEIVILVVGSWLPPTLHQIIIKGNDYS